MKENLETFLFGYRDSSVCLEGFNSFWDKDYVIETYKDFESFKKTVEALLEDTPYKMPSEEILQEWFMRGPVSCPYQ